MGSNQCCQKQPTAEELDNGMQELDDDQYLQQNLQQLSKNDNKDAKNNNEEADLAGSERQTTDIDAQYDDDLKSLMENAQLDFEAPKPSFALPLDKSEEEKYLYTMRMQQYIKHYWRPINLQLIEKIKYLPFQVVPYKILSDSSIFVGTWYRGMPEGYGKIIFIQASNQLSQQQDIISKDNKTQISKVYEGQVRQGMPHGMGRMLNRSLVCYVGRFRNGVMDGEGELTRPDGFIYKGTFFNSKPHGQGLEKWPNGVVYNGCYKDGLKFGRGRLAWPLPKKDKPDKASGTPETNAPNPETHTQRPDEAAEKKEDTKEEQQELYDGEFANNLFHGKGTYKWKDGRVYEGQWDQGKMQGKGKFTWKPDCFYEGDYLNDLKHGYGEFHFSAECSWKGTWKYGKQDGNGSLQVGNEVYEGVWENGRRKCWIKGPKQSAQSNINLLSNVKNEINLMQSQQQQQQPSTEPVQNINQSSAQANQLISPFTVTQLMVQPAIQDQTGSNAFVDHQEQISPSFPNQGIESKADPYAIGRFDQIKGSSLQPTQFQGANAPQPTNQVNSYLNQFDSTENQANKFQQAQQINAVGLNNQGMAASNNLAGANVGSNNLIGANFGSNNFAGGSNGQPPLQIDKAQGQLGDQKSQPVMSIQDPLQHSFQGMGSQKPVQVQQSQKPVQVQQSQKPETKALDIQPQAQPQQLNLDKKPDVQEMRDAKLGASPQFSPHTESKPENKAEGQQLLLQNQLGQPQAQNLQSPQSQNLQSPQNMHSQASQPQIQHSQASQPQIQHSQASQSQIQQSLSPSQQKPGNPQEQPAMHLLTLSPDSDGKQADLSQQKKAQAQQLDSKDKMAEIRLNTDPELQVPFHQGQLQA